jgi:hypothetical protein
LQHEPLGDRDQHARDRVRIEVAPDEAIMLAAFDCATSKARGV